MPDFITRPQCKLRSLLRDDFTPAQKSRIVRQDRLVVKVHNCATKVIKLAAYVVIQLGARARLQSWGLFEVDPSVDPERVGDFNVTIRVVPPNLDPEGLPDNWRYVRRPPLGLDVPAFPLTGRGQREFLTETLYSTFYSLLYQNRLVRRALNDVEEIWYTCISPLLTQRDRTEPVPLQPIDHQVRMDDPRMAPLKVLWDRDRRENWSSQGAEIARECMTDNRSFIVRNFGKAIGRAIAACGKLLPFDEETKAEIIERIEPWMNPAFLVHTIINMDDYSWDWTDQHPIFRQAADEWLEGWERKRDRQIVLEAFQDIHRVLCWMLRYAQITEVDVFGWPPAGNVWTAEECASEMKHCRWEKFLIKKTALVEPAFVAMEYFSSIHHYVKKDFQGNLPDGFKGIQLAPLTKDFILSPVTYNYAYWSNCITRAVAVRSGAHEDEDAIAALEDGLPGIPAALLEVKIANFDDAPTILPGFGQRTTTAWHRNESWSKYIDISKANCQIKTVHTFRKCSTEVPIGRFCVESDGSYCKLKVEVLPTAVQIREQPWLGQSRIPTVKDARKAIYHAVPPPRSPYPGTNHTGTLSSEFAQPILPAEVFIDHRPVIGVDPNAHWHVACTDKNPAEARRIYQAQLESIQERADDSWQISETNEQGIEMERQATPEEIEQLRRRAEAAAKEEYKSHCWGVTNRHSRMRTGATRRERMLERLKWKDLHDYVAKLDAGEHPRRKPIFLIEEDLKIRSRALYGSNTRDSCQYIDQVFEVYDHLADFYAKKTKALDDRYLRQTTNRRYEDRMEAFVRKRITKEQFLDQGRTTLIRNNRRSRQWPINPPPPNFQQPTIAFGKGYTTFKPGKPHVRGYAPVGSEKLKVKLAVKGATVVEVSEDRSSWPCPASMPILDQGLPEEDSEPHPVVLLNRLVLDNECDDETHTPEKRLRGQQERTGHHGKTRYCIDEEGQFEKRPSHDEDKYKRIKWWRTVGCVLPSCAVNDEEVDIEQFSERGKRPRPLTAVWSKDFHVDANSHRTRLQHYSRMEGRGHPPWTTRRTHFNAPASGQAWNDHNWTHIRPRARNRS